MSYLLPASYAPRTKNKWGLGALPLKNGNMILYKGPPVWQGPVLPGPMPVAPIIKIGPFTNAPPAPVASTPATPVPANFPTNQFYVAPDGSVWEYSVSGNKWFNTGTPYNVNAPSGGATGPTPAAPVDSGASQPPVSVTVSTPATESGYQSVLDWLTQQTLISGFPNWLLLAGGALAYKMFSSSSTGRGR